MCGTSSAFSVAACRVLSAVTSDTTWSYPAAPMSAKRYGSTAGVTSGVAYTQTNPSSSRVANDGTRRAGPSASAPTRDGMNRQPPSAPKRHPW